jgi:phosphatidylserine/phosphatidylglycerophosphate/cardiolipin synthase-like enzyme
VLKAGNDYPPTLAAANSKLMQFQVDDLKVTTWFAPTKNEPDLNYARKLIANAKHGILFLFFNPGTYQEDPEKETLLQNVLERHDPRDPNYNAGLYIKGVVNQEIKGLTNEVINRPPVNLYANGQSAPQHLNRDVLTPANIKKQFHSFEDEALRASLVMVHSKVVVLDPLGEYPVVMTGSHNLGLKASAKNDDNLVILEGPVAAPLAVSYALNIIAIYQTYRWNAYVTQHQQDPSAWHGLQADASWQNGHLQGDSLAELQFWMAQQLPAAAQAAAAAPAAAGAAAASAAPPGHRTTRSAGIRHARNTRKH